MSKLYVELEFNANTKKAKEQIASLQQTLNNAINESTDAKDFGLTPKLEQARKSAMTLKSALQTAMNPDTGKLNLTKFTSELKGAGLNVKQLAADMRALGPTGVQAFQQTAQAVAMAETRIFSLTGGLKKFVDTFANTLRYQAATMAIQSVTNSVRETISFVKDLDKSLTDIQMVTGRSDASMAKFAKTANKAAKELHTTTTKYAEASLIYFQQGLSEAEVKKRTDVTVKLAGAVGQSASEVSDWMTSIWNNFDDGSKSLEYYADVVAKLGAATASSADEIATGLEKFAAIADTVGLSYEYAAAALATVTAETRQSAEVVGTAFKTIFARMEGLKLGETLDDGTTLNQYSNALASVGVNIKDANGELRNMDQILDDTAARWSTLSKDQQVALAQSVAGVRQYSQFIALMDNYNIMESNIEMAKSSTGALEDMYKGYANSVEGMTNYAQASAEKLKLSLVGADDLKTFYKVIGDITEGIGDFLKSFGGLKNILILASSLLLKMYQPQITKFFQNSANAVLDFGSAMKNAFSKEAGYQFRSSRGDKVKQEFIKEAGDMEYGQEGGQASYDLTKKIISTKMELVSNEDKLTQAQKDQLSWQIQILEKQRDYIRNQGKELENMEIMAEEQNDMLKHKADEANAARKKSGAEKTSIIKDSADTLGHQMLAIEEHGTSKDVTEEQRIALGDRIIETFNRAKQAAADLGVEISDLGFEDAEADVEKFKNGSLEDLQSLYDKLATIKEKMSNLTSENTEVKTREYDTGYISTKGREIGKLKASGERGVNLAEQAKHIPDTDEARSALADKMSAALADTRVNAEDVGQSIDDSVYDQLSERIEAFKDGSLQDIKALIAAWKEYNEVVQQSADAATQEVKDNVITGAVKGTDATTAEGEKTLAAVDKIDDSKDGAQDLKAAKEQLKLQMKQRAELQQQIKAKRQEIAAKKKSKASTIEEEKALAKLNAELEDNTKNVSKSIKEVKKLGKQQDKNIDFTESQAEGTEEYSEALEEAGDEIDTAVDAQIEYGKKTEEVAGANKDAEDSVDGLNKKMNDYANNAQSGMQSIMTGISSVVSLASGLNMISSGFENLAYNIEKARIGAEDSKLSFGDLMGSITAIGGGILQVLPSIVQLIGLIKVKKTVSKQAADSAVKDSAKEIAADQAEQASNLVTAGTEIAKDAAKGPSGWAIAAISAAAVAAIVGVGFAVAVKKGKEKAQNEKESEDIEKTSEVATELTEIAESSKALDTSIDKFRELAAVGADTYDALQDIISGTEEFIKRIDELNSKGLGVNIDTTDLQAALDYAKKTGNIDWLEQEQNKIQEQAFKGSSDKAYEAYTRKLQQKKQGVEVDEEELKELRSAWLSAQSEYAEFSGLKDEIYDQIVSEGITDTEQMKKRYQELLAEKTGQTTDDTDALNYQVNTSGKTASDIGMRKQFEEGGRFALQIGANKKKLEEAKAWFESLPEEDKTLVGKIDFSADPAQWKEQMEEARAQAAEAQVESKAESLGYDTNTLEMYTDLLVSNNDALTENNALSKQIALNNMRLNKGLASLANGWSDIKGVLVEGKRNSLEYAEALGKVSKAFEEAFGYAPSADWIEEHIEEIQDLAEGETEALAKIQDALSQEMVANIEWRTSINGQEFSLGQIQDTLYGMLDELGNAPLEIGSEAQISQSYMDSLQAMLDNGQLTIDELQKIMRAKGFEMEITGWKTVPGPEKVITQHITSSNGDNYTKTIRENEEMKIPIINGDDSQISSGSVSGSASIVRSSNETMIDASTTDKNSNEDSKKDLEEETERYHEIDKTLDRLGKEYDRISKAKDRAFGKKHLDLLDQEIAKTEELADATNLKLKEAETNFDNDRTTMISKYGMSTDQYGNITNYDELVAAQVEAFNANPEGQADAYEQFQKDLEQYEETLELIRDLQDDYNDYLNQQIDLKLEKIDYSMELEIRIAEIDMERIEFQMNTLSDSIADATKKFQLMGQSMDVSVRKAEAAKTSIEDTLALSGVTLEDIQGKSSEELEAFLKDKNFTEEQIAKLESDLSSLYGSVEEMQELMDSISDTIVESFESMNEEFDKSLSKVDHLTSMIEGYQNIIDLAGKDSLGISDALLKKMGETSYKIANDNIRITKAQMEQNQAALASIQEKIDKAKAEGNEGLLKEYQEAYDEIYETVQDNEQALLDATSAALEKRTELFQTEMNSIIETFEKALSGAYGSISAMQESFAQQKELQDLFIDDYTKIYELSKLNRELAKKIDDTDSVKAKEKLRDLQEEINALQESNTEMTQYEVEELRARYDLRLAEIALEEAQKAKSQVRMQRTAEGNWGYVYTADDSAVDTAQQSYEDKLYAYQQKLNSYIDEMQERMISIPQEYADAVKAIYDDQTLNDEEKRLRILETQAHYETMYSHVVSQLGVATEDSRKLYEQDWKTYSAMTGYKISEGARWVDSFDETIVANMLGISSLSEAENIFVSQSKTLISDLSTAYSDYRTDVSGTLEEAVGDLETFVGDDNTEGSLAYWLNEAEEATDDLADAAGDMAEDNKQAFEDVVDEAEAQFNEYSDIVSWWIECTSGVATSVSNLITSYSELGTELENLATDYTNAATAMALLTGEQLKNKEANKITSSRAITTYYSGSGANREDSTHAKASGIEKGQDLSDSYIVGYGDGTYEIRIRGDNGSITGGYINAEDAKYLESQGVRVTQSYDANIEANWGRTKAEYQANNGGSSKDANVDADPPFEKGDKVQFKTSMKKDGKPVAYLGKGKSGEYSEKTYYLGANEDLLGEKEILGVLNDYGMGDGQRYYTLKDTTYAGTWGDTYYYIVPEKTLEPSSYDTGGYTGQWDSSGRLAMLHQKEIVLNAHDTANFLAAIDVLRDITSVIDLQALSQSNLLGSLNATTIGPSAQVVEQQVTIHAEFPNATQRTEIEAAFDTLLNRASQFANRKN